MVTDDLPTPGAEPQRTRARRRPISPAEVVIVPANEAGWADLQTLFGSRGDPSRCWCQRFRMSPGESWANQGPDELEARLRVQTACDQPSAPTTSGLVAYLGTEPVGWCAVAPRPDHHRMLRNNRVPWDGRNEDKFDSTVWAVTCFVTRAGYGRRGISHALAAAAVTFAQARGARAVEGYPDLVEGGYAGTRNTFLEAGFTEVHQPTKRKVVMRVDFAHPG
jgi:GNAT superfamily N-acetyltransferase